MTLCYKILVKPGNIREVVREAGKSPVSPVISIGRYHIWPHSFDGERGDDYIHYMDILVNGKKVNLLKEIQYSKVDYNRNYMERKAGQLGRILKKKSIDAWLVNNYMQEHRKAEEILNSTLAISRGEIKVPGYSKNF